MLSAQHGTSAAELRQQLCASRSGNHSPLGCSSIEGHLVGQAPTDMGPAAGSCERRYPLKAVPAHTLEQACTGLCMERASCGHACSSKPARAAPPGATHLQNTSPALEVVVLSAQQLPSSAPGTEAGQSSGAAMHYLPSARQGHLRSSGHVVTGPCTSQLQRSRGLAGRLGACLPWHLLQAAPPVSYGQLALPLGFHACTWGCRCDSRHGKRPDGPHEAPAAECCVRIIFTD